MTYKLQNHMLCVYYLQISLIFISILHQCKGTDTNIFSKENVISPKLGFGWSWISKYRNCNYACGQARFYYLPVLKLFCQYNCPNSTVANIDLFPTSSTSTTVASNNGAQNNIINSGLSVTNKPPTSAGSNPGSAAGNKPPGNNNIQNPGTGVVPLGGNPAGVGPSAENPPQAAETGPPAESAPAAENPPPEQR